MSRMPFPLLLALLPACTAGGTDKTDTGSPGDSAADSADSSDSGGAVAACADGSWGPNATGSTNALYVSSGATGTTGGADDPVGTVAEAMALATLDTEIVVGAGSFPAQALFQDEAAQAGIHIVGCGRGETTITPSDPTTAALFAHDVTGLQFAGFTISGGNRSVWLQGNTEATLTDVVVDAPAGTGIFIYGAVTASLSDVEVKNPTGADDSAYAYGISVRGESEVNQANVSMEGGGIVAAMPIGFIGEAAEVTLVDVSISDTLADADGFFGRGLQLQGYSSGAIQGASSFDHNVDAGVFGLDVLDFAIAGTTSISDTQAGLTVAVDGSSVSTGDGLVVALSEGHDAAFSYTAAVEAGATFRDNVRNAAVFDAVDYSVGAVNAASNGSLYAQDGATDLASSSDVVAAGTAFDLNLAEAGLEDP